MRINFGMSVEDKVVDGRMEDGRKVPRLDGWSPGGKSADIEKTFGWPNHFQGYLFLNYKMLSKNTKGSRV